MKAEHAVPAKCPHCGESQTYNESTHVFVSAKQGTHTHCRRCNLRIIFGVWLTPVPRGSTRVHWSKP